MVQTQGALSDTNPARREKQATAFNAGLRNRPAFSDSRCLPNNGRRDKEEAPCGLLMDTTPSQHGLSLLRSLSWAPGYTQGSEPPQPQVVSVAIVGPPPSTPGITQAAECVLSQGHMCSCRDTVEWLGESGGKVRASLLLWSLVRTLVPWWPSK